MTGHRAVKMNQCFIGHSHCPSEVVSLVQKDGSIFCIKLHYDSGAGHSLANEMVKPIVTKSVRSRYPIQLARIQGSTKAVRTIASVRIKDTELDCILVKSLNVDTKTMPVPPIWKEY